MQIFTDGSCIPNPGPGGWGFTVWKEDEIYFDCGGDTWTTNNKMELTAMLEALLWVEEHFSNHGASPIVIYADSQYVRKGLTEWINGWKRKNWRKSDGQAVLNKEEWVKLDSVYGRIKAHITIVWVKGHSGDPGNERADELADLGRINVSKD